MNNSTLHEALLKLAKHLFILTILIASINTHAKYKKSSIVFETHSNTTFSTNNSNKKVYPASLTKLLTAHIILRDISDTGIKVTISEKAWGHKFRFGSRMFLEPNMKVSYRQLLSGLLIQSGNDAAIALAEGHSGSEKAFVQEMNKTAKRLNMTGSNFKNPNGRHNKDHYTTASDFKKLINAIFKTTPQITKYTSKKEFTFNEIPQSNRNKSLINNKSVGLKTGFTPQSGFNLASCFELNKGIFCTVEFGANTSSERFVKTNKAFRDVFSKHKLVHINAFRKTIKLEGQEYFMTLDKDISLITLEKDTVKTSLKRKKHLNNKDSVGELTVSINNMKHSFNVSLIKKES